MGRSNELKVVEQPSDLEGTPLGRRPFMNMLKAGGALTLGASLAGCSDSSDSPDDEGATATDTATATEGDEPASLDELVIGTTTDADMLDPHRSQLASAEQIMAFLYDGMILLDDDWNVQESLGKGFDVSDDGTEWTIEFNVDSGITFHNGDEFTVDDVVFTWNRFLETSIHRWSVGSLEGVEKVDERTVRFSFAQPYAFFRTHVAINSFFGILPQDLAGKSEDEFARQPVGTGPYQLDEWLNGQQIVLSRNDDWETPTFDFIQSEDPPVPRKIVFRIIPSATTRTQALLAGELDAITGVPIAPNQRSRLDSSNDVNLKSIPGDSVFYVPLHTQKAPTDSRAVRRAINHAIDKQRIVQGIYDGAATVNYSPMPGGHRPWAGPTVREEVGYEYDADRAGELLSDAGWEAGNGEYRKKDGETLKLEMVAPNTPPLQLQTSEEIAAMLEEVGFNVDLSTTQPNQAVRTMATGEANLTYTAVGWYTPAVLQFSYSSATVGQSNFSFLEDDEVDQLLGQAQATLDPDARGELYTDLQLRLMDLAVTVPVLSPMLDTAISSNLTGHRVLSGGTADDVWLDVREA